MRLTFWGLKIVFREKRQKETNKQAKLGLTLSSKYFFSNKKKKQKKKTHLSRVDLGLNANLFGNLDAVGLQNQPVRKNAKKCVNV